MELLDVGNLALQAGLSPQAARAAMAIAKTEGGLSGAVGDNGQSFGPFQFYAGGQLKNFARALGVTLAQAGHIARSQPETAVQWALRPGGYLGDTLRAAERQGLKGGELATYAQRYGQVSVAPERAGQNYQSLWGGTPAAGDQQAASIGSPTPLPQVQSQAQPAPPQQSQLAFQPINVTGSSFYNNLWNQVMNPSRQAPAMSMGGPPPSMPPQPMPAGDGWGQVATGAGPAPRASQFGNKQLTPQEAAAWCGPDAAMAFASSYGRTPTLNEAKQLAAKRGWTPGAGMAGPQSESQLLSDMGVRNTYTPGVDWGNVQKTVGAGKPVILSTPGHYFYTTGYDPTKDAYNVGTSGTDLRGGSEWMTPQQMQGFSVTGPFQGAIFGEGGGGDPDPDPDLRMHLGGADLANPRPGDIQQYIDQAARKRGIDPETAMAVAYNEGGLDQPAQQGSFSTGRSYWPYQLHYGGRGTPYAGWGSVAGLGNEFTDKTGWQPGDPKAWRDSVDFALDRAVDRGWYPTFYGSEPAGVSARQGLPQERA